MSAERGSSLLAAAQPLSRSLSLAAARRAVQRPPTLHLPLPPGLACREANSGRGSCGLIRHQREHRLYNLTTILSCAMG